MALQKFHTLQPSSIAHLDGHIRRALCDKDPSVMAATLCLLMDLIKCVRACVCVRGLIGWWGRYALPPHGLD